jgi:molybdopterin synthase sulfur carrier subunit
MTQVTVLYFASLRDVARIDAEAVQTQATDLAALYAELRQRHGFAMAPEQLRVAVDGAFAHWQDALREASEIAFIPPVSGG